MKNEGFCLCCDSHTTFESKNDWLRDNYRCLNCGSIPRHRALMKTIEMFYPNWRELDIHESSPNNTRLNFKLKNESKNYIYSQFCPDKKNGEFYQINGKKDFLTGFYNINLEKKHFKKECFDLVITQDVFEHIYNPKNALKNIYRTLKKGGAHICTIPMVNKNKPTEKWSVMKKGEVVWLHEPDFHGNPVGENSPVSYHYGYDLSFLVQKWSKFMCTIVNIEDIRLGIKADVNEVLVMKKRAL